MWYRLGMITASRSRLMSAQSIVANEEWYWVEVVMLNGVSVRILQQVIRSSNRFFLTESKNQKQKKSPPPKSQVPVKSFEDWQNDTISKVLRITLDVSLVIYIYKENGGGGINSLAIA